MSRRNRKFGLFGWLGVLVVLVPLATIVGLWRPWKSDASFSSDLEVISLGEKIYAERCAVCHGQRLQGQPNWQSPLPNGRMPAPPHNSDGHTWHHDSTSLFAITKHGLVPPWAPPDYRSNMPAFQGRLSDGEIWAVLSFIASQWNDEARKWQRQIEMQEK
ncbi:MAG: cytochrome c [Geminicoccaceae bacterium]